MSASELSVAFFLQMAVILAACRIVGFFARRIGQPQVVGEMIAGVILGPSVFGLLLPDLQQILFPPETLNVLYVGAQLGVGLYMFIVGLEFDPAHFRRSVRGAAAVSIAGMAVPFLLAVLLASWLLDQPGFFAPETRWFEAALFTGAAIAITAFPMLARIIHEHGYTGTALGTLALSAGAIDDAAAWAVLAVVLATFGGDALIAIKAVTGGIAYALVIIFIARRLLAPLGRMAERTGRVDPTLLGITLTIFLVCAWAMDAVGVHAVFGGFLLGTAMPRGLFNREVRRQIEPFTVVFLLPMFFTYSGLNTRLDLLFSPSLLLAAGALLLASILGKGVACWAAARLVGQDQRTSLAIGTLMNARGLMELIILNIGLHRGIIGPEFFSIMVAMAVITTLMASPLFQLVHPTNSPTTNSPPKPSSPLAKDLTAPPI